MHSYLRRKRTKPDTVNDACNHARRSFHLVNHIDRARPERRAGARVRGGAARGRRRAAARSQHEASSDTPGQSSESSVSDSGGDSDSEYVPPPSFIASNYEEEIAKLTTSKSPKKADTAIDLRAAPHVQSNGRRDPDADYTWRGATADPGNI